ncbi:tRNA pseudouridine(38-40) synthase TruA [Ulvibacterium sp.]|uniref:tRNA pseudouridine(38-40) synthase TruA n=1 Tax=Ulvibacterium sp. TaxID=2665914 RepID=UPI00345D0817
MKEKFVYIVKVQFLGFRYSGWQKQPNLKTVEGMLIKTLKFIIPRLSFKILGAGRTDAKVSALSAAFTLTLKESPIQDKNNFIRLFNENLPPDIRIVSLEETKSDFNIIQDAKIKEYVYLFSFGRKNHPFCAPFMANFLEHLDIQLMEKAAKLFVGTHDFSAYTSRLQQNTKTVRTITSCGIGPNNLLKANFFPKTSYAFRVSGAGFMRYQIRMMMGALVQLGKGALSLEDIRLSLASGSEVQFTYVAPGSGLILNELEFVKDAV